MTGTQRVGANVFQTVHTGVRAAAKCLAVCALLLKHSDHAVAQSEQKLLEWRGLYWVFKVSERRTKRRWKNRWNSEARSFTVSAATLPVLAACWRQMHSTDSSCCLYFFFFLPAIVRHNRTRPALNRIKLNITDRKPTTTLLWLKAKQRWWSETKRRFKTRTIPCLSFFQVDPLVSVHFV